MNDEPEIVETDTIAEHAEVEVYEEPTRDLRGADSEEQLAQVVQDHIVNDFEAALNLIRDYQVLCKRALVPDLHWQRAHDLLAKYGIESVDPSVRIYDPEYGDITTHTTSVKGDAEEIVPEQIAESTIEIDDPDDPNFTYRVTVKTSESLDESSALADLTTATNGTIMKHRSRQHPEPEPADAPDVETLKAEGYVMCPICEGTGKAKVGVLKGRLCRRCGGYGVWKPPETAELVEDEKGIRLRPTGGQPVDDPKVDNEIDEIERADGR